MSTLDIAGYNRLQQVFTGGNVSAKSVIAVAAATTGLALYNPYGSGKKLILVQVGFSWTTAPAAVHNLGLGLVAAAAALPTSLTAAGSGVKLADGTGTAGSSISALYDAATFATAPVAAQWMGGCVYGSGVGESPYTMNYCPDGTIMVVPGSAVALIALTTTCVGVGSFTWIEVPQ